VDRATVLAAAGDPEAASRAALDGAATAQRAGVSGPLTAVLAAISGRELLRMGRWDDAWMAVRESAQADPQVSAAARVVLGILAVRRGDPATGESVLATVDIADLAATPGSGWVGLHALAGAELALARGGLERARVVVADGLARSEGDPDALQRAELAWLGLRIEADGVIQARARRDAAAVAAGEVSAMAMSAAGHSELAGISSPGLAAWLGAMRSRLDAEVSRLRGMADPPAWQAAVAYADRTPDVFGQAYTRYRLAESMLDRGVDDRVMATRVLQDCLGLARSLGAAPLREDAQRLAIRARIRLDVAPVDAVVSASTTPRRSARELGLSEREVDVLELLAVGMTDRDIGARLFITEKTASHHVSHILTKLTVARRGEAAAVAHRLGVIGPGA
jgi:DNA-binding CsgD family transcriptional regulator